MRILIIGGTRFVGPYVANNLASAGHEVTVFHRGQHEATISSRVQHFRSPLAAMPVLNIPNELLAFEPEIVIHMIAMGEADAKIAVGTFSGRSRRMVVLSSGDVYLAYGRFTGLEPGPVEVGLLTEESPVRGRLYPYRDKAKSAEELNYFYEKILVEQIVMGNEELPATVLRLPKVYGPAENSDFATVFSFRNHPHWRWTHGYVENVAAAIVLAVLHPAAAGRTYNVGEAHTPTVAERTAGSPPSTVPAAEDGLYSFDQDLAYDTSRIREELGYCEPVQYEEGVRRTIEQRSPASFLPEL